MMRITRRFTLLGGLAAAAAQGQNAQLVSWPAGYAEHMAHAHAGERMFATTSGAPTPSIDVAGEEITYGTAKDGTPIKGYLAHPSQGGPYPGIIAIHEWWGLNEQVRGTARRLAGQGYAVLAVDLYGGKVATSADSAQSYMKVVIASPDAGMENL